MDRSRSFLRDSIKKTRLLGGGFFFCMAIKIAIYIIKITETDIEGSLLIQD